MRRALPLLLAAVLAAVPVAPATAVSPAPPAAATSVDLQAQVADLQRAVDRAGDELAAGAARVEAAERRLVDLTAAQVDAARRYERTADDVVDAQSQVDALARSAYKGSLLPPAVSLVLAADPRAAADLARVQEAVGSTGSLRADEVADLTGQLAQGARALQAAQELRATAVRDRERLALDVAALGQRADELAAELTVRSRQLELMRAEEAARAAARAAAAQQEAQQAALAARQAVPSALLGTATATGGGCAPVAEHGFANGFLPDDVLCPVPGPAGSRLRTDAARAFTALSAAAAAETGVPLCLTDSYRDYAGQVDVFRRKPALAAVPGRSQHGWGLAVDLCGGVEVFGSPAHEWVRANAGRFGWVHPAWAQQDGSKPEAWHWEYRPAGS